MRLALRISIAALFVPVAASAQVIEHDRVPSGYNKHPINSAAPKRCSPERDRNAELHQMMSRTDPIPNYGWVWVTVDAIRKLEWPTAASRVDRSLWDTILKRAQRDSIRDFEGTPVVVDGYLVLEEGLRTPFVATEAMRKSSRDCDLTGERVNYHFWLTADRGQSLEHAIPVTVTPQMRQRGWDIAKLDGIARRGLMVRVWGWLLFDPEDARQLVAIGRSERPGTPWELHPIVEIEVFRDRQTLIPLRGWED